MSSTVSTSSSTAGKFRFDLSEEHKKLLHITKGKWYVETDGHDEFDIVDERGLPLAIVHGAKLNLREMAANAQCFALVPELVRALYVATRALKGSIPDNESPQTIADELSRLLWRCYSIPEEGGTIRT